MSPRPTVTVTYAQSLDGRIATSTGSSQWISGEETLRLAHELRRDHDAILVGSGTVAADDPELTSRIPDGRNPHRFILDSGLRTPLESKIVRTAGRVETTIFCANGADDGRRLALENAAVSVVPVPGNEFGLNLRAVLEHLHEQRLGSLLVEGGAAVLTGFFRARLVDRLVLVCAPMVIGAGTEAIADLGVRDLSTAQRGTTVSVTQMGSDVVWEVRFDAE